MLRLNILKHFLWRQLSGHTTACCIFTLMSTLSISVHISSYVSISAFLFQQHSCGLYLSSTGISTHVSEGVRVSEGAHRENLAQELANRQRREAISSTSVEEVVSALHVLLGEEGPERVRILLTRPTDQSPPSYNPPKAKQRGLDFTRQAVDTRVRLTGFS